MSAEALDIITKQLSQQAQRFQTETTSLNLAATLKDKSVELLSKEGHTHTFYADRIMGLAVLPITILARVKLSEIYPLQRAVQRFLQIDQATYIIRFVTEGNRKEPIMLFADDGNPNKASSIQIGAWHSTEYLHIDTRSGRAEPLVLCTLEDPRFSNIPNTDTSSGARFDGSRAKILRVASESDMQDYTKLFTTLKGLDHEAEPVVSLPSLKRPLGYLPLSPIRRAN